MKNGITLLELMIVLVLMAAIASISYPNISRMLRKSESANYEQRKIEIIKDIEYKSAISGEIYVIIDDGLKLIRC